MLQKAAMLARQLYEVFQKTGGKSANWYSRRATKTQGQWSTGTGEVESVQTNPMAGTANPATSTTNLGTCRPVWTLRVLVGKLNPQ
eukprot:3056472-Amphidinium_carterae.2